MPTVQEWLLAVPSSLIEILLMMKARIGKNEVSFARTSNSGLGPTRALPLGSGPESSRDNTIPEAYRCTDGLSRCPRCSSRSCRR